MDVGVREVAGVVVVVDVPWDRPQEAAIPQRTALHLAGGAKDDGTAAPSEAGENGHVCGGARSESKSEGGKGGGEAAPPRLTSCEGSGTLDCSVTIASSMEARMVKEVEAAPGRPRGSRSYECGSGVHARPEGPRDLCGWAPDGLRPGRRAA